MAQGIGGTIKSFWHTMTSYDRHSAHDSSHRTSGSGQGIGRNPGLHGVRTSIYSDDPSGSGLAARSTTALAASGPHSAGIYSPPITGTAPLTGSPPSTYTPGARSATLARVSADGSVPLQDFGTDGMAPPPPVSHSWARIERWTDANYPELKDQICEGATLNDINELEYELDCTLPMDVRESITIHDGQERGGMPTGVVFGAMLLDCEEILDEWRNWKTVNQEFLAAPDGEITMSKSKAAILARQDSSPDGAVQKVYCHPGWIPLARDWGGNNIAVDLAPGPAGKWGQIILMGRDYDVKYVVARSWAAFLAAVADDMESPHWYVDEDTSELRLKDPRAPRRDPSYFDILRVRNMQRYRRAPPRRINTAASSVAGGSQHGSAPGSPASDRGRAPRVAAAAAAAGSSRHSSPGAGSLQPPIKRLPRVNEELGGTPLATSTSVGAASASGTSTPTTTRAKENGVLVDDDEDDMVVVDMASPPKAVTAKGKEKEKAAPGSGVDVAGARLQEISLADDDDGADEKSDKQPPKLVKKESDLLVREEEASR